MTACKNPRWNDYPLGVWRGLTPVDETVDVAALSLLVDGAVIRYRVPRHSLRLMRDAIQDVLDRVDHSDSSSGSAHVAGSSPDDREKV